MSFVLSAMPTHGPLRAALALGVMLGLGASGAPASAKPKSEIAIKTKAADIAVRMDAAIKANAPLAANLRAEGKRWAEKNLAEATKELKEDPEWFRDGRSWSFERNYTTRSVIDDRYVSILMADYIYTGGAHPNTNLDTILWDDTAKKRISIRPFFTDLSDNSPALNAIRKAVIVALKAEKKARGIDEPNDDWAKYLEPKLLKIGAVELAPSRDAGKSSGLIFNYSPYAVGSYAEGSYEAFVPWTVLKPYLSPEGVAIFGGERPKSEKSEK